MRRRVFDAFLALVLVMGLSLVKVTPVDAANRTATVSGNWSNAATWGGTVPVANDTAIIPAGITVTVDVATAAVKITLSCGATTGSTLAAGGGTLNLGGVVTVTSAATGTSGATIACPVALAGTYVWTVNDDGTSATDLTISGIVSGGFGLTKAGAGTLALSGVNTYTGITTINLGTLSVATIGNGGVAGNLGAATNAATNLVLGGGTLQYTGSIASTNRNFTLTTGTTSTIEVTTNTLTMSGASTNTTGALTKAGAGTLVLSGANLYTGLTTVSAGTLQYGIANALSRGGVTVSGGTLDMQTYSDTVGAVTLTSGTIAGTSGVLTGTSYAVQSGTVSAILGGAVRIPVSPDSLGGVALTKSTSGTVTMSGVNTYTGVTTISAGTLSVGTIGNGGVAGNLGAAANLAANLVLGAGTLQYTGSTASTDRNFTLTAATTSTIEVTANTLTMSGASTNTTGALTKAGAGTLVLSGANLYTGLTTVSAGTLQYGANNVLSSASVTVSGGTLDLSTFTESASGTLTVSSGATLRIGGSNSLPTFTTAYSFDAASTTEYYGASQAVGATTYGNLTINQSSGNATLGGAATVNGILTLTAGNLAVTDPNILTMGASATTVGATDVTGIVTRTSFVAATTYTFGNQYTTMNFRNVGTLPTAVSMKITIGSAPLWKAGAVQRTYDIIRTGGSGTVTMALHYLDAELNGNNEATMVLWDCNTPFTVGTGEEHGRSNYDTTNNWDGISSFDVTYLPTSYDQKRWTLANTNLATATWTGALSTNWMATGNWTPTGVPSDVSSVIIANVATAPTLELDLAVGTLTINSGATLNSAANSTITISGGNGAWSDNGGTFNASTSTVVFTNAAATISGVTEFYNVTINSGAAVTMGSGGSMRISGTMTNNGTWRAAQLSGTTVEYDGGSQTVVNPNGATPGYDNLILSGSGTKTMPGTALSILGNFTMSGTATAAPAAGLTIGGAATFGSGTTFTGGSLTHNVAGNWVNNGGTVALTGTTINLNGSGAQLMNGSAGTTFSGLTLNNSNGLTISNNETVNGMLVFTSGKITTGANTVIMGTGGSVFGAGSSSYVIGNLQKYALTGSPIIAFEVGTTNYNPVTVAFGTVSVVGNLIAKAVSGDHDNIASSAINSGKDVNAYWTLTNSGISFNNYGVTFNFVSGDLDAGANTSTFIVAKYNSGWTYPTVGARTSTSTQATGLNSFGDFAMGELTWLSYNTDTYIPANEDNDFVSPNRTVYMHAANLSATTLYRIAFYDAPGAHSADAHKISTQDISTYGSGNLNVILAITTYLGTADTGTWHAIVSDPGQTPPDTYDSGWAYLLGDHSFVVEQSAIPEFTTVVAAIGVVGLCFAIYYWMRKKRLAFVKA